MIWISAIIWWNSIKILDTCEKYMWSIIIKIEGEHNANSHVITYYLNQLKMIWTILLKTIKNLCHILKSENRVKSYNTMIMPNIGTISNNFEYWIFMI